MLPDGNVDVVLDTDAYNESDDQFAIAYSCIVVSEFTLSKYDRYYK